MLSHSDIKDQALQSLSGQWGNAAVAVLVYYILLLIAGWIPVANIVAIIIGCIFNYWIALAMLTVTRGGNIELANSLQPASEVRAWATLLLSQLYVFLWTLLLVVPGLIKSYSYAMTPFVLADDPNISYNAAIDRSCALMDGHKLDLFLLDLSFIGWILLSLLTCGIGFLWLIPYMQASHALYYRQLTENTEAQADGAWTTISR